MDKSCAGASHVRRLESFRMQSTATGGESDARISWDEIQMDGLQVVPPTERPSRQTIIPRKLVGGHRNTLPVPTNNARRRGGSVNSNTESYS